MAAVQAETPATSAAILTREAHDLPREFDVLGIVGNLCNPHDGCFEKGGCRVLGVFALPRSDFQTENILLRDLVTNPRKFQHAVITDGTGFGNMVSPSAVKLYFDGRWTSHIRA